MEYSNYSFLQMHKQYGDKLLSVVNTFLNLAKDKEIKDKIYRIFYYGGYGNYKLSTDNISHKDNISIDFQRRISMAYLLLTNPDTFDIFAQNNINLFHGTNGNALPGILKYGLTSEKVSGENKINVMTGEFSTKVGGVRSFVSMTNVFSIAEDYSQLTPNGKYDEKLSFPVIIGTSEDKIMGKTCSVHSDVPEVGIRDMLPKESISLIGVPSDKIKMVKRLVGNNNIKVVSIDGLDEKFYYFDDWTGFVNIIPEKLEEFKSGKVSSKKKFSIEEIRQFVMDRFSKMKVQVSSSEDKKYGSR